MYPFYSEAYRNFIEIEECASTNSRLKSRIYEEKEKVFTVLSAKSQSGGRGRLGRSFFSPRGGLYFSAAFPLAGDETNTAFLTLLCGLKVCEVLKDLCSAPASLKWPNDIMLKEKKLGGILCELISQKEPTAIIGVGINFDISDEALPEPLKELVCSLRSEGFSPPEKNECIKSIVSALDKAVYIDGELYSPSAATLDKIKALSCSLGKSVSFGANGKLFSGIITDIAPDGAAVVKLPDGQEQKINSAYSLI